MILSMPTAALHPCAFSRCPALVGLGVRYCPTHEKVARVADQQRRGTAAERGYGARWQRARLVFLGANPLCLPCSKKSPPQVTAATVVDHIKDHKGDQQLFWDTKNWQPSCQPCHDARTDAGDFGRIG